MSHAETIVAALRNSSGLTDSELTQRTRMRHQTVNQVCRKLACERRIIREHGPGCHLVNRLLGPPPNGHRTEPSHARLSAALASRMQRGSLTELGQLDISQTLF